MVNYNSSLTSKDEDYTNKPTVKDNAWETHFRQLNS